jgi:polar amino acid transport system substrate-binding protein
VKHAILFAALLFPAVAQAAPLTLTTESYPPFNFRENGEYKGASVEQVDTLMKAAGIDYKMEMMPWARAFALAENDGNTCVFSTVHNQERDPAFKWIEPLLTSRTVLIRKAGSGVDPKSLADARQFNVGTQRDDFTQTILQENGFARIDLATDLELTMKKLLSGRVDLMPISEKYYDKLKREGVPIEATLVLAQDVYSIACNPGVPDETVAKMQAGLDALIADGTQKRLFEKYGLADD